MSRRDAGTKTRWTTSPAALVLAAILTAVAPGSLAAETVAVVGGTVHTLGAAGVVEGGTVLFEDGRVTAVGADVEVPAGARVVDAAGKVVTPGLLDSFTQLGLVEVSAVDGSRDTAVDDDRITAAFRVVDALNPDSSLLPVARVEGVTRALVVPSPAGSLLAGQAAVIQLGGGDPVVRAPAALYAVLGEAGAARSGGSRGGAVLRLREAFEDARDYADHRQDFERRERRNYALSRLDLEALVPVLAGEVPLLVRAQRASDLRTAMRLADEYGLRLVIVGATEGWRVADELAAAGVPVVIDPLDDLPSSFESLAATLQNAARLQAAGVRVVFMTGSAHDTRNLRQLAGNAVANGLPWEEGLRAVTAGAAEVWGLEGYGRLEVGYEADVVVWDGDPLEVTSFPEVVFIRGVEMPRETRQELLLQRYRDLPQEGEVPVAYVKP